MYLNKEKTSKVNKVSRGKYIVNGCKVEYYRNAHYDCFDGKYHSGWIVTMPDGTMYDRADKQSAFNTAFQMNK